MIQDNLLLIAGSVFLLMLVGLILTVVEFKYGAPKRQHDEEIANDHPER